MNASPGKSSMRIGIVLLALLAAARLLFESRRLLLDQAFVGAVDLKIFHTQSVNWWSGQDIYTGPSAVAYPPATYPLLAPIYILDVEINRWVWCCHALIVLGVLLWMFVRESGAASREEKLCVVLVPLAAYSTGVTFGNGQPTIHILAAGLVAALLLYESRGRWPYELGAAACMLVALIKPSLTAPFFWIFLLVPKRKLAAAMVVVGYVALTFVGASVQPASLMDQFRGSLSNGEAVAARAGYGSVSTWLGAAGYGTLIKPFLTASLVGMGIWVWLNRRVDRWLLLGGLAIMTRLWAYHRLYDDMLDLVAFIALMRLAKGRAGHAGPDRVAWIVLLIALTTIVVPATPLEFWRGGLSALLRGWQTAVRLLMLVVIMHRAWLWRSETQGARAHFVSARR